MYRTFFKLEEKPFNLTPDPRYLYLNANHREVLASLQYGIMEKRGFIVITGEVGTGKTTHLFNFFEQLGEKSVSAFIFNPILTREEFFQYIFEDFGLPRGAKTKTEYLVGLNRFLLEQAERQVTPVLVIDEAQNLSPEILEEVRLLSNLETTREKLLQIILVGQPELDAKLQMPSLRQLRQRISIRGRILPLTVGETGAFIRHRLQVAGYAGTEEIFNAEILALIAELSAGIPRVINNLCDNVLVSCYALGRKTANRETLLEVAADLELLPGDPPPGEALALESREGPPEIQVLESTADDASVPVLVTAGVAGSPEEGPQSRTSATAGYGAEEECPEPGLPPPGSWDRSMKFLQSFIDRLKLENE
jgi:type II secretory pathway predicted ATPase ExeA